MSLLLETPATGTPSRPGRRGKALPVVAALCVLLGVVGSLVLVAPRLASFPPVSPRATGAPYVTVPEFGPRGSHVLGYLHGARVRLTLPLRNSGPLPLTVTSVELGGGPTPLLSLRGVTRLPLTLRPGGSGAVTLTIAMVNCRFFNEREMQTYAGVTVGFRSLGRSATRVVPFDRPILVKSPMIVTCPDRRLDRSTNRPSGVA